MSTKSLPPSGVALRLVRSRSPTAAVAWLVLHGVAAAGTLGSGLPRYVKLGAIMLLLLHAGWRRPRPSAALERRTDGSWRRAGSSEPLALGPGTRYTRAWIRLELIGVGGCATEVIWRDELDAAGWRRLQLAVRDHDHRRSE